MPTKREEKTEMEFLLDYSTEHIDNQNIMHEKLGKRLKIDKKKVYWKAAGLQS